ncbi:MAG: hypothetical protein KBA13_09820, partial [Chitinophagales bacterium]|nr:hypothetical protein [Chitinophagales bacterium]
KTKQKMTTVLIVQIVILTVGSLALLVNRKNIVVFLQVIALTVRTLDKVVLVKILMTYNKMKRKTTANSTYKKLAV